ncbi:MAG: hypothetical protein WBG90_12495 [Saonia sp.]
MKKLLFTIVPVFFFTCNIVTAQNAEQILAKYTKVTGGQKSWDKINSMKITGTAKLISQGGMELPFLRIMKKNGKQITTLQVNGMDYISIAFDGTKAWGSNQQMQPEEKSTDITKNTQLLRYDFPYPGHNWKQNGYRLEYLGKVTINDSETFKLKLTKLPQWVEGKETENVLFLYIDTKRYVPILTESEVVTGEGKGKIMKSYLSNYKDVDGYLYPFTVTMKYGDDTFQILKTTSVAWNLEIDDTIFDMPSN